MKLTVKEYATSLNVSIQSVYKKIKRGSLTTVKENNITYVLIDSLEVEKVVKPVQSNDCTELLDIIRRRDKEVKQLHKEIKRLTKELSQAQLHSMATMKGYIDKLETMQLLSESVKVHEEEFIDVKNKKKSKKNKKKKS